MLIVHLSSCMVQKDCLKWAVLACRFTEADLRMYPTIIRYDGCYTTLFKCCRKRIGDYPHLSAWLADVHQLTVKDSPNLQVHQRALLSHADVRYLL